MVIHGDSLVELTKREADSVDLLCTDPPYGYSFMGKSWDKTLPDIGIFKECLRVLKPGAFAFVMSAPRSDVCARMMLLLEDAGFNIGFTPIYWTYASGFPKAMNIGKMVDKRNGEKVRTGIGIRVAGQTGKLVNPLSVRDGGEPFTAKSEEAKALEGSYGGFQPKPAVEVVIVAMKPLSEKTFVDQALKNGKGITWLDDCRVPIASADADIIKAKANKENRATGGGNGSVGVSNENAIDRFAKMDYERGRFPANLLVSDDVLNDGRTFKSGGGNRNGATKEGAFAGIGDTGTTREFAANEGSYSRYFSLDSWSKTLPFLIVPKAAKSEKDAGCEEFEIKRPDTRTSSGMGSFEEKGVLPGRNSHPTVKPLKLMSYLITLGSRPGDVVLDPFLGSGSTAIAAKQLGRKYIGIEREKEYVEIAEARLKACNNLPI